MGIRSPSMLNRVRALAGSDIVNGMNGKIEPKAYFTRAQAAVILDRIWNWND